MQIGNRAIFRLDSDLYPDTVTGKNKTGVELENGAFVKVGELEDNEAGRETYKLSKLSAGDEKFLGFISSPNLMYDERQDERDYVCAQDELVRVYRPNSSTVGTFAKKHFNDDSSINVGDKLTIHPSSNQLTKVTSEEEVVAILIAKEDFEGQESFVIRFV